MFESPRVASVALAGVLVALSASAVRAHGDHDWIRQRGHLSADGKPCCGKDDCTPLIPERVKQTASGYSLLEFGLVVPYREARPSEDGKYWLCMTHSTRVRCFFAPPSGM